MDATDAAALGDHERAAVGRDFGAGIAEAERVRGTSAAVKAAARALGDVVDGAGGEVEAPDAALLAGEDQAEAPLAIVDNGPTGRRRRKRGLSG